MPDDWFIYFADLLVITIVTLALPINMLTKVVYVLALIDADSWSLSMTDFSPTNIIGVILFLVAASIFSLIVYYMMQQAHFSAFTSLQAEQSANSELRNAMRSIDTLQHLLPVCANCKKVRDDNGYWEQIDEYINAHSDVSITHSICPGCFSDLYSDFVEG